MLLHLQLQHARFAIPVALDVQPRRAGLVIPTAKLGEIKGRRHGGGILHRLHEVFAGGGGAVVAAHIERHPPHKRLLTQQGVQHTNKFRSLFVDRGGVEVVDRLIGIRLHGMGSGASIFTKLAITQHRNIFDAIQCRTVHIFREALVAKHG